MAGKPSGDMVEAMKLVIYHGMTPYAAGVRCQLDKSSIYRSRIYKMWHRGDVEGAKQAIRELDPHQPRVRMSRKARALKRMGNSNE